MKALSLSDVKITWTAITDGLNVHKILAFIWKPNLLGFHASPAYLWCAESDSPRETGRESLVKSTE